MEKSYERYRAYCDVCGGSQTMREWDLRECRECGASEILIFPQAEK